MKTLEKYIKEIAEDLRIDEMNVKDVQMRLPARKHFWAAKLIQHKIEQDKIRKQKHVLKKTLIEEINDRSPTTLTKPQLETAADKHSDLTELNERLVELGHIIDLLERAEKTFSSCSFDISNIIKLLQMEQL